jgi:hypothetical protein
VGSKLWFATPVRRAGLSSIVALVCFVRRVGLRINRAKAVASTACLGDARTVYNASWNLYQVMHIVVLGLHTTCLATPAPTPLPPVPTPPLVLPTPSPTTPPPPTPAPTSLACLPGKYSAWDFGQTNSDTRSKIESLPSHFSVKCFPCPVGKFQEVSQTTNCHLFRKLLVEFGQGTSPKAL